MGNNLICRIILMLSLLSSPTVLALQANHDTLKYQSPEQIKLSGPRIGFTLILGDLADTLKARYDAAPFITQFGWQFERRFMASEDGFCGLAETVLLVGGIEQELFLPSLSFLVGLRTAKGTEFGFGPNLSLSGIAYVFAGGVTKRYGNLNFPINLSAVLSKSGFRISLLFGFNMVKR
ncbi:hypothetical protein L0128_12360 [candidate division KSB1 bacterium]|nr:hypothetical protein [candidate division KSB1 bacterium]